MNRKSIRNTVIISIIIFIVYIFSASFYIIHVRKSLLKSVQAQLKEISQQITNNIEFQLSEPLNLTKTLSTNQYLANPDISIEEKLQTLRPFIAEEKLFSMGIIDHDFISVSTSTVRKFDADENEWIQKAFNGKANMALTVVEIEGKKTEMLFSAAPLIYNNEITGVIFACKTSEALTGFVQISIFGGAGEIYILNDRSQILFKSFGAEQQVNTLVSDFIENPQLALNAFREARKKNTDTRVNLIINNKSYIANYSSIPSVKGWNVLITVPDDYLLQDEMNIIYSIIAITIAIIIIFIFLTILYMKWNKKNEEKLYRSAYIDPLTGLFNEAKIKLDLEDTIKKAIKKGADPILEPIFTLDIDNFKIYNKIYGTEVCDQLLIAIGKSLKIHFSDNYNDVEEPAVIGRMQGDIFAVIIKGNNDITILTKNLERFISDIQNTTINNSSFKSISFSIGIVFISANDDDAILVLEKADAARKSVKNNDNKMYTFYSPEMLMPFYEEQEIKNDLRVAISNGDFKVYYQPKYNIKTKKICGFEGLIRWEHKEKGYVSPAKFIPIAEQSGNIVQIGRFVFDRVCSDVRDWTKKGLLDKDSTVSVNSSVSEIFQPDFLDYVKRTLKKYDIPPKTIEIEITETMAITNIDTITSIIYELNNLGVNVSIDDFGTGNTAFTVLKDIPVDVLKLDRSFLTDIETKDHAKEILRLVIDFATKMDIKILAEGVENEEQVKILLENGCYLVQGYFFGRPMSRENTYDILAQNKTNPDKDIS